jgi:hypothetical protein
MLFHHFSSLNNGLFRGGFVYNIVMEQMRPQLKYYGNLLERLGIVEHEILQLRNSITNLPLK